MSTPTPDRKRVLNEASTIAHLKRMLTNANAIAVEHERTARKQAAEIARLKSVVSELEVENAELKARIGVPY